MVRSNAWCIREISVIRGEKYETINNVLHVFPAGMGKERTF